MRTTTLPPSRPRSSRESGVKQVSRSSVSQLEPARPERFIDPSRTRWSRKLGPPASRISALTMRRSSMMSVVAMTPSMPGTEMMRRIRPRY